jgi:hypothetical protein
MSEHERFMSALRQTYPPKAGTIISGRRVAYLRKRNRRSIESLLAQSREWTNRIWNGWVNVY